MWRKGTEILLKLREQTLHMLHTNDGIGGGGGGGGCGCGIACLLPEMGDGGGGKSSWSKSRWKSKQQEICFFKQS